MRGFLIIAGVAMPGIAVAQAPDPAHSPGFVHIDRYDATSVGGGDITYVALDDEGLADDVTILRFQLGGRYVDQASRLGGYLNLPITYASGDGESLTGIGNLEIGGLMLPKIGDGSMALVLHAGITLPIGSDGEDAFANLFGAVARPQDIYLALPEATTLRIGASPMWRSGNVFGRVDLGLDYNIDVGNTSEEADPLVHINAGIGVDLGTAAVMGELSNVYIFSDDDDDDFSDRMINVFALSARFSTGKAMPYVSLTIPIDGDSREAIDLAFTAGVEARL